MTELAKIQEVLGRTRLRLKLQLMLERATTLAVVAVALGVVALFFYKSRSLDFAGLMWVGALLGTLVGGGAIWGFMTPLSARYVLKRLDVANDTRDALGSAFDFTSRLSVAQGDQQAELMRAQIRQAEKRLARLDLRRASRFR
ncbi:MAG: hypothetical protein RBU30_27395, partial [Polyangia bacterium]|nr:hypothetical protein [Polyangia bacterium]